jgi:DNA-binding MarR family transcriptional regulator
VTDKNATVLIARLARAVRKRFELTPQGERALCEVDRALQSVEDEILAGLDADERATLHRLLARLSLTDPECPADE